MKASLYKQLCSSQLLMSAWQRVKAKDSIGGIDGISLLEFEKNLASNIGNIKKSLETKQIKPLPYKQIEILKKDGDKRRLSMLSKNKESVWTYQILP
jgi:retron-type reverse transcriptase